MDATLRHLQLRRPKPLCRSFPQWARARCDEGLIYRLYLRAGEGMAEVRHLVLPADTGRQAIAQALVATRQEMQEARGPRRDQVRARPRQSTQPTQDPRAVDVAPAAHAMPTVERAVPFEPSADAQMGLF